MQLAEFETTSKSMEQAAVDADCEVAARCIDELLTEAARPPDHTEASVNVAPIRHPSGDALEHILQQSAYASVRNIKARIERNVVVLQGDVPTFYLRQLALAASDEASPWNLYRRLHQSQLRPNSQYEAASAIFELRTITLNNGSDQK